MENETQQVVHGYNDVISDAGLGQRIEDGDVITITGVTIDEGPFGSYVVFDTFGGRRYSGAIAIVDFGLKLREKLDLLPVTVRAVEVTSAIGRRYLRFTQA